MRIAVVNSGSATIKAALLDVGPGGTEELARAARDLAPRQPLSAVCEALLSEVCGQQRVDAVAHRVVHGGKLSACSEITPAVEAAIRDAIHLAPLHNPEALACIAAARELFPGRPMVAVFDTAFHANMPAEARSFALPPDVVSRLGLVRYGYHGLAHESLTQQLSAATGVPIEATAGVTLQLGSGCSAAAIRDGQSIETSMGFSTFDGLVMARRPGSVDPGVVLELIQTGMTVDEVRALFSERSGLLGVGGDGDIRALLRREAAGDEPATLALGLFVHRIVATVGAYFTFLGGHGALVFGGGIGTHSAVIRERVAKRLHAWQIALDPTRNAEPQPGMISVAGSRPVYVFETNEERVAATEAYVCLTGWRDTHD
ncbi:MAG: acetate/propionate family kinase [Tepidiformaceae bacterium]